MAHDRPRSLIRPGRISDYKVKRKKLQHSISRFTNSFSVTRPAAFLKARRCRRSCRIERRICG